MSGKEKFHGVGRSATAGQKRNQQLELWEKSITNRESSEISTQRKRPRVRFGESVVFLAACQSGDAEEVERLLGEEGANINSVNKDGLTALHQCCIDDDFEIVQLLVRHGANLDVHDNEGWTPLHAATSCGYDHIVSHLLDNGAYPVPVNNEGDTPLDLADDDVIRDLITEAIHRQDVDVSDAKMREEGLMLADANRLKNDPSLAPAISPGGATVVHVAAAKNYLSVLEVLLSQERLVNNIDSRDEDGWTALHAAVYWENMEAAAMLVKKGAGVHLVTKAGDTIDDLCRPEFVDELEELKELCESTSRNRCYAMNHKRPSLLHQSSRDDITGGKPSPTGLRRRSSRDRSMFPKMDMASEKATIESWTPEEVSDGNHREIGSGGGNIEVFEETQTKASCSVEQETHSETENNVKEAVNSLKEKEMAAEEEANHVAVSTSKPPLPPGTSPQSSPRVQPKVEPSESNDKLSSPLASPKTNKRRPISGQMMKRLTLWEQQSSTNLNPPAAQGPSPSTSPQHTPQHTPHTSSEPPRAPQASGGGETKRFPFIPKTVTATSSKGEDRLKPGKASSKRNSYDETRLAHSLPSEEATPSRTSSLPRNTRMLLESAQTPPTTSGEGAEVAVMTTEAMPTRSVPTEGNLSRGGEGAKVEEPRELLRGESVESLRSDRSFTEESETNRKRKAKKTRETRKKTQPVPANLFEKLAQLDSSAEKGEEEGKGGEGERVRGEVERERMEFVEQLRSSSVSTTKQSAYRPTARPSPRFQPTGTSTPKTEVAEKQQQTPSDKDGDLGEVRDGEEEGSEKRSRTKSAVRRKPREQRKSTGIVIDKADLKNASEEVASLFRKSAAGPESMSTGGPESTSSDAVSSLRLELKELKQSYDQANEEMAGLKGRVSELSRRLEDATRAYQQERRDKEEKEQHISRLQLEARSRDELKVENQRLRDENSALIRVIGKLSRAPIRPTAT